MIPVKENTVVKHHQVRQVFPKKLLEKLSQENAFTAISKEVEDTRCQTDIMYKLFKRPHLIVDKLLNGLVELTKKKNSPNLEQSRLFREATQILRENSMLPDCIKVYMILIIINIDTDAQGVMRKGYQPQNLWGTNAQSHFSTFLQKLNMLINESMLQQFAYHNIVHIVKTFLVKAEQLYMGCY